MPRAQIWIFKELSLPCLYHWKFLILKSGLTRFKWIDVEGQDCRGQDDWAKLTFKLPTWLVAMEAATIWKESMTWKLIKNKRRIRIDHVRVDRWWQPLAAFNHHFRRVDFSLGLGHGESVHFGTGSALCLLEWHGHCRVYSEWAYKKEQQQWKRKRRYNYVKGAIDIIMRILV